MFVGPLLGAALLLSESALAARPRPFIHTDSPEWMAREGVTDQVAPWEDGLRHDTGSGNFEWWYFDAHFDDGSSAVINFLTKRILKRRKGLQPKMEITFTPAGGQPQQDWTFPDAKTFSAAEDHCEITLGKSWVKGDLETYQLHVEGDFLSGDLTFTRQGPSWRPGAGKVYFNEEATEYLGWVVAVPYGHVEGTLTWRDGTTQQVNGHGYHDHNWGNTSLNRVLDSWIWGRSHNGDYTVLFFDATGSRKWGHEHLRFFLLAKEEEVLIPGARAVQVTTGEFIDDIQKKGRPYATVIDIDADTDPRAHVVLTDPAILERQDLLDGVPWLLRGAVRHFTNPWYYRFGAHQELSVQGEHTTDTVEGEAIYEFMLFR